MERYASLDKSRLLNFKIRIGETSVPKILTFVNADGSPYNISGKGFELPVKKMPGTTANLFKLTEGDGLTIEGAGENKLRIEVNATRAGVTKQDNVFFGTLYSSVEDHTWLNGDWEFHNGKYDGVTESDTITIAENGDNITITVSGEQSISVLTQTTTATITPDGIYDAYALTAQVTALTLANPSTDYPNFDGFMARIYTAGAQTLTLGNKYRAQGEAFPATTTAGKVMIITAIYDSATDKYDTRISIEV